MLTKLDCYYHSAPDGSESSSMPCSFVILNPIKQPGTLVAACSVGIKESIGSQVACRLAIENFTEGVLSRFASGEPPSASSELATEVLEAAFRSANSSVYAFGHKLAAGGRMGASLVGIVITEDFVAGGRAGPGSVYLQRGTEVFPFFADPKRREVGEVPEQERLVGAHSLVSVELASVPLENHDRVLLFSSVLDTSAEKRLAVVNRSEMEPKENPASYLLRRLMPDANYGDEFGLVVDIGPRAIYLDKAVP